MRRSEEQPVADKKGRGLRVQIHAQIMTIDLLRRATHRRGPGLSGWMRSGLDTMDANHLTLASTQKADFFSTCDDRLHRKAMTIPGLSCKISALLGLVPEVTK